MCARIQRMTVSAQRIPIDHAPSVVVNIEADGVCDAQRYGNKLPVMLARCVGSGSVYSLGMHMD